MKTTILTGYLALTSIVSFSQQNTVTTGGDASGSNGSISYTVGQIDYLNASGSNGSINEGVQQPYEFFTTGIGEINLIQVELYPNPTNEFVILSIQNLLDNLDYSLYDLNGKIILTGKIDSKKTLLDFRQMANGEYLLHIQQEKKQMKSLKIIKN